LVSGCASTPPSASSTSSSAYQAAVDQAFADLQARDTVRSPASSGLAAQAVQNFSKTQSFEVVAYPKLMSFPKSDRDPKTKLKLGSPVTFQYRVDRQGKCALGKTVVPADQIANCVQVEIKPVASPKHIGQFIRVFMTPDYRVYGISYHDLNASTGNVKTRRTIVKWDQSEPLSSDSLSLSKQFVPLDLPIYATNAVRLAASDITINTGTRKGETCNGWKVRYHNTYGSNVKADWCSNDPWPTVVETDRYVAVLNKKAGG
jgi:hypothetical protein